MAAPNIVGAAQIALLPIQTLTASYQINGGTAISSGAQVTDSVTFTGAAVGDDFYVTNKSTPQIPTGLQLIGSVVSATNTVQLTWRNVTGQSITPPASATWYCVIVRQAFA